MKKSINFPLKFLKKFIILSFLLFFSSPILAVSPTDVTLSSSDIYESMPLGAAVGSFSSIDADVMDTHTYTLVPGVGDSDNGSFTISGDYLLSNAVFDSEIKSSYSIRVQTDDGTGGLFEKSFTITVNAASLIGDYHFDSCSLGTMVDDSLSGNDGAVQNVESEDIYPKHEDKGMMCRAGRFYSFVANYATTGTNLHADANGSFSIVFSVEWSGNLGDLPIITREDDYSLKINNGKLYYTLDTNTTYTQVPNFSLSQNIASHVSFIVTTAEVKVYKDAVLTDIITHAYTNPNNNNVTYIGTDDQTNYFSGLLDEINFYKGIINQTTITELFDKELRACACCTSNIKIKGDYISISNTYVSSEPVWDSVTYNGFTFDEPPLLFMLPNDNGSHSAYIRAKDVTETGFEAANIEPQGEDGPHIAMDLSYIAISRGLHDLGEYTLEACTIPIQTEQFHLRSGDISDYADVNLSNQTPYGTISCDSNGCWTKISTSTTYTQPVVFATLMSTENELRDDQDPFSGTELSRPWMTVAVKNDATGIWVSLERSETTYGKITKPELVAYMITEGNIQSSFVDDFDNNVSYETIYLQDRFLGTNMKNNISQQFDFNNTYSTGTPLVMANKQSRKDADGGWFRLNGSPEADRLRVSIWEDRVGSHGSEHLYVNPDGGIPIGVSANQDEERNRDIRDDGAAIIFSGTFQYAESYQPIAGNFDAVEAGALFNTILDTKIVNKPFELKYWSLDKDNNNLTITKVINSPVKVDFIYSQNPGINLDCNDTTNPIIPGSTKYAHFTQPNPYIDNVAYNITDFTAYRNVQARFTFGSDSSGNAVDWLTCYNNSGDCGDSVYTNACTATCTTNVNSARSEACAECYFNNVSSNEIGRSCSFDRFAIRPDAFEIAIEGSTVDNQTLVAGISFQVDADAIGFNSTTSSQDYNATQSNAGMPSQFHIAPTDLNSGSGCATGLIIDIDDNNFTDGDFSDGNGKYTEIGDINITIFEDPNKVFATVDTGNVNGSLDSAQSVYTIPSDSIRVQFIPDHFRITANLSNNSNGFTYISSDLNVSSTLDINITAESDINSTLTNYNVNCYAKTTTYDISYNNITITPTNHLSNVNYVETNTSTNGSVSINTNIGLANITNSIFSTDNNGSASISIDINFDRNTNESVNPFDLTIRNVNVTDVDGTFGTIDINDVSTFIYGRTHATKQRFTVPDDGPLYTVNMYYESYCFGMGCVKTLLPDGIPSINTDDIRWYRNSLHLNTDGSPGVVNEDSLNNVTVPGGINIIPNPNTLNLLYNHTSGINHYPYVTTMENNASSWLIYNEDDNSSIVNQFQVEFNSAGTWSGAHDVDMNTTTNIKAIPKTNRRSNW